MFRKNPAASAKRGESDGIDNLIDGLNPPQPTTSDDIASTSDDEEEIACLFEGYGSEKSDDEDEDWPEEGNDAAWEEGMELVGPNSNSQTVVKRAIDKTRNMVKLLRKSALARDAAENIRATMESPPPMPLALDVRTRWNSCLHMIKEVLKNQATYERLHSEVRRITDKHSPVRKIITQCDLSAMDYEILTSLALCLEPFNEVTSYLGVTKFSTLPTLLISIMLVKSFLVQLENSNELQRQHRFCAKLLPALKQKLGKYFSYTTENDWVVCACYLNPDSRNMSAASEAAAPEYTITDERGRSAVFACLQSLGLLDDESGENTPASPAIKEIGDVILRDDAPVDFRAFVKDAMSVTREVRVGEETKEERIERFLNTYEVRARDAKLRHGLLSEEGIPAGPSGSGRRFELFWSQCRDMPELFSLSELVSTAPSTSLSSESCFSLTGSLVRANRAKMSCARLRGLVLCREMF